MRYFHEEIVTECISESVESGRLRTLRRRAATAMEYLFVASLILCAVIVGIGYFGQSTKATMQKSSDSIQQATSTN